MTGIYVHVPFCVSKCPYCDFYSLPLSSVDADMRVRYAAAVVREMERYDGVCADTLYFGGGTPSLLGGENLAAVIAAARKRFSLSDDAEVTLEAGMTHYCPEGHTHGIENTGSEPLVLLGILPNMK